MAREILLESEETLHGSTPDPSEEEIARETRGEPGGGPQRHVETMECERPWEKGVGDLHSTQHF